MKQQYEKRLTLLSNDRQSFVEHWKEIKQYIAPYRGRFEDDNVNDGKRKGQDIIRDTAGLALRVFSSGMMAGVTSPAYSWFRFRPADLDLQDFNPVKEWLYICEQRMRDVFNASNLYRCLPSLYSELGLFGTSCMYVDKSFKDVIRCFVPTIGSYYCANNDEYRVDVTYRKFQMTVAQLMQKQEKEGWNVSERVKNMFKEGNLESWINVLHVVEPNDGRINEKGLSSQMPYKSVYLECGYSQENQLLHVGGFEENPAMVIRWDTVGEDVWGLDSPAMKALGDVKQLQTQLKEKGKAIAKKVSPPLVGPPRLAGKKINALPNGYTEAEEIEGQSKLRSLYEVNISVAELAQDIMETQELIKQAFFSDLFLMLANSDRRNITAREVAERHEEKLLMLGPVLVRVHDELLSPLIERTFGIMLRGGLFPPIPDELKGMELKIEFVSLLAQAQKSLGVQAIDEMAGFVANISALDPNARHKLDINEVIDARAEALGVPPNILRTNAEVEAIVQAESQAQQQAQMMQQMQGMAGMAKDLGQASDTRLPEMLQGMSGQGL